LAEQASRSSARLSTNSEPFRFDQLTARLSEAIEPLTPSPTIEAAFPLRRKDAGPAERPTIRSELIA
jgi:hypothetical protein